jgi:hypothetical protein
MINKVKRDGMIPRVGVSEAKWAVKKIMMQGIMRGDWTLQIHDKNIRAEQERYRVEHGLKKREVCKMK